MPLSTQAPDCSGGEVFTMQLAVSKILLADMQSSKVKSDDPVSWSLSGINFVT
jgi:hypothetical protein